MLFYRWVLWNVNFDCCSRWRLSSGPRVGGNGSVPRRELMMQTATECRWSNKYCEVNGRRGKEVQFASPSTWPSATADWRSAILLCIEWREIPLSLAHNIYDVMRCMLNSFTDRFVSQIIEYDPRGDYLYHCVSAIFFLYRRSRYRGCDVILLWQCEVSFGIW